MGSAVNEKGYPSFAGVGLVQVLITRAREAHARAGLFGPVAGRVRLLEVCKPRTPLLPGWVH